MPVASGAAGKKYHYQDHDTDYIDIAPPVQNDWYTIFEADDVRLILCAVAQTNDEAATKSLEVRWTCDGNVYFIAMGYPASEQQQYVYRNKYPSTGGTKGLSYAIVETVAGIQMDKRALHFKVEVRITAAVGTNQHLNGWCVRETLEET